MVSLHNLINQRFGVRTRSVDNREATAITITSQVIARNDSARLALNIVNQGQQVVNVRNQDAPTAAIGYSIGPNGGSLTLNLDEDFNMVGHEWQAITPSGTSTLFVQEVLVEPDA